MKKYLYVLSVLCLMGYNGIALTPDHNTMAKDKAPEGFVYIPEGINSNVSLLSNTPVSAFYLYKNETTNGEYQQFLDDLKKAGKTTELEIARIQSEKWKESDITGSNLYEPATEYPVVNISREGAELYCKWLENKLNTEAAGKQTYIVRLPTSLEWEYAARGGIKSSPYPWYGPYVRNSKGCYLAQFRALGLVLGPTKVRSYYANLYGLFNMAGNVAEMVSDTNFTHGGSWNSTEYYLQVESLEPLKVGPTVGFRPLLIIKK